MIYRKEALENQSNKNFSNISLVRPFSKTLYISLLLLTTTLIATFLFTGEYTRYISVKGITLPEDGYIKIQTNESGLIKNQYFKVGDHVKKNDLLYTLEINGYKKEIRSPVEGSISIINSIANKFQKKERTMMIITPSNKLKINLYLESQYISKVKINNKVLLKYDSYPYQTYGMREGYIYKISNMAYSASDIDPDNLILNNDKKGEIYFLIEVKIKESNKKYYENKIEERAGLTLTAEIKQDRKKIIAWILTPFKN